MSRPSYLWNLRKATSTSMPHRSCGLQQQQQRIGITEKKAIKRYQIMNESLLREGPRTRPGEKNQTLAFVHSQKETAKTVKFLLETAIEKEINHLVRQVRRNDLLR